MTVIGINFGNSYASIAVLGKDGEAECIANEDGERQIACAVSFHGEQVYIGNQAKHQLVKNAQNTILGFRNVLGKSFSQISQQHPSTLPSAPLIQHPDHPSLPAYKVSVLAPSPTPLPPSSRTTTPHPSVPPTPRTEPSLVDRYFTPEEITALFLHTLIKSASAFLGTKVTGAVISVPSEWAVSGPERLALQRALEEGGEGESEVKLLMPLEEVGAVIAATSPSSSSSSTDHTQLIIDIGHSHTTATLLSLRQGLAYPLASRTTSTASGSLVDGVLAKFFASDFTKKTKLPLALPLGSHNDKVSPQDQRALTKLYLALEHVKRSLSSSNTTSSEGTAQTQTQTQTTRAATCSIESLKDGMDYTGSINRMRFEVLVAPVWGAVASLVRDVLQSASSSSPSSSTPGVESGETRSKGIDPHEISQIIYVGGTASLPGLDEHLVRVLGFDEGVQRNGFGFGSGSTSASGTKTTEGGADTTELLAKGCAVQAGVVGSLALASSTSAGKDGKDENTKDTEENKELLEAFKQGTESAVAKVRATSRGVGVVLPCAAPVGWGVQDAPLKITIPGYVPALRGTYIPLIPRETALPARRAVSLEVGVSSSEKVVVEVWEVDEYVKVERRVVRREREEEEDEDEEEEEEEEVTKHAVVEPKTLLGVVLLKPKLAIKATGKLADPRLKGTPTTQITIKCVIGIEGDVEVEVAEVGGAAEGNGQGGAGGGELKGAVERVYVPGLGV